MNRLHRKNIHEAGTSLIEVLAYIALFSILALGFVMFSFGFWRSIDLAKIKDEELTMHSHVHELIRHHVHHSNNVEIYAASGTPSLILSGESGIHSIDEAYISRLLKYNPYSGFILIGFEKLNSNIHAIEVTYELHKDEHVILIDTL